MKKKTTLNEWILNEEYKIHPTQASKEKNQLDVLFVVCMSITAILILSLIALIIYKVNQSAGVEVVKSSTTYNDILRVFLHEEDHVSFLLKDVENIVHVKRAKVRFIIDVIPKDPMWAIVSKREMSNSHYSWTEAEIHIHGPAEIDGGSWDHDKFGKGTTVVVE